MTKYKEFADFVHKHLIEPNDLLYNSNALTGEAGEVANVVKKLFIRLKLPEEEIITMNTLEDYNNNLNEELGDVLFYLIAVARIQNISLEDIIDAQDKQYNKTFLK